MRRTLLKAMCTGQWSRYELWLGLRMVGMLLLLPLLQRALTLPTLLHLLDARTVSPARITVSRLCALLDGVLQQHSALLRPTCVKKSLILFRHLRRWGYPVQIHFGVVKHVWSLKEVLCYRVPPWPHLRQAKTGCRLRNWVWRGWRTLRGRLTGVGEVLQTGLEDS